MGTVQQLETSIEKAFKDLPHLPESSREGLAKIWPWLALIGGIVQLLAAWGLWQLTRSIDSVNEFANSLSLYVTGETAGLTAVDKTVIYVGIAVLLVDAVILLMAYGPLKARDRKGWDLLFLASLVNLAYAVVTLFIDGRGAGSFVMSLIGSALGFYLLFEVKSKFSKPAPTV